MSEEKRCIACGRDLPADLDHFHRDPHVRSGLSGACKECRRATERARELAATTTPLVHPVHTVTNLGGAGAWHHTPLNADPEEPAPRLILRGPFSPPRFPAPVPAAPHISPRRILALRRLHTRDGVTAEELAGRCGIDLARVRAILREGAR